MSTIERTKEAVQTKTYSYEALIALLAYVSPEAVGGLVDMLNYVVGEDSGLGIPEDWKPKIRFAAFLLALIARSIVVRKPKGQGAEPTP